MNAEISTEIRDRERELLVEAARDARHERHGDEDGVARMKARMPITGACTSDMALKVSVARRHPLLDVMLHRLDDDDGVVDDEPDREDEGEQ